MSHRARTGLLVTAAIALAASSAGVAAASSSSSTVSTCANKSTGVLRVASKCSKEEKAYKLGQVGPTGAAGKAGSTGATGPQGPAGPAGTNGANGANGSVAAYYDFNDAAPVLAANATDQTVATLANLPAGAYAISAKLWAINNGTTTLQLNCRLNSDGDSDTTSGLMTSSPSQSMPFAFDLVHVDPATFSATVTCNSSGAGGVGVHNIKIVALPLAGVASRTTG